MGLRRKQRGFLLLETMLAMFIIISLVATVLWLKERSNDMDNANSVGQNLLELSNALNTYATMQFTPLVNGQTVTGVASEYAPTIAELKTLGYLSTAYLANNHYGGSYAMKVSLAPSGCVAPACDLRTLAWMTTPIVNSLTRRVDTAALGQAAASVGGNAGYSTAASPSLISGLEGGWSTMNPVGSVVGILAVQGGYSSMGFSQFTRRDGSAPPTGPWNMNAINVSNINALGSTTLNNSGAATIGGTENVGGATTLNSTLSVAGTSTTHGVTNTGNITNTGALVNGGNITDSGTLTVNGTTTTQGITNTGNITNSGDVITGRLWLRTIVSNGAACPGLDGYQAATAAGSIASCINGIWTTPNATTSPPSPCATQAVSWGSGCKGSVAGNVSGGTGSTSSTYGTGSATFICSNGSWLFQSGTCTPPAPSCSAGSVSWGSGCSGSISSGASGTTGSSSATYGTGSATFVCSSGNWLYQSGTCTLPAPSCGAQTLTWGSGCKGTVAAGASGSSGSVTATYGTGTASFMCSSGSWLLQSGTCTPPAAGCTGTVSWGGGICSANVNLTSGATQAYSNASGHIDPSGMGGTYTGSATIACNNGSTTISAATCVYKVANPQAIDTDATAGAHNLNKQPSNIYLSAADSTAQSWCSAVLPGSTQTYTYFDGGEGAQWSCWNNSGYTCDIAWDGSAAGPNGQSCWNYGTTSGGGHCYLIGSLTCTRNGT
ncbi:hypothetical protein PUN4_230139 [Paraburkholderia unamae]|uniref:type II secretion system protein n=1 Tax=Paraburkholderia unamae TaxID=219649 RepID=UPI001CB565D6|nr:type II secretion system protein [Paraburkholderia unamae]CAG9255245.1 hypothetical protein PUN4_230139 [Paraburkholderia unamae]